MKRKAWKNNPELRVPLPRSLRPAVTMVLPVPLRQNPDPRLRELERAALGGDPEDRAAFAAGRRRAGEGVEDWELHPLSYVFLRAAELGRDGRLEGELIQDSIYATHGMDTEFIMGGTSTSTVEPLPYVDHPMHPSMLQQENVLLRAFRPIKGGLVRFYARGKLDTFAGAAGELAGNWPGVPIPYPSDRADGPAYLVPSYSPRYNDQSPPLDPTQFKWARIMTKKKGRWKNNPDVDLRELERRAAGGDREAEAALIREQRRGRVPAEHLAIWSFLDVLREAAPLYDFNVTREFKHLPTYDARAWAQIWRRDYPNRSHLKFGVFVRPELAYVTIRAHVLDSDPSDVIARVEPTKSAAYGRSHRDYAASTAVADALEARGVKLMTGAPQNNPGDEGLRRAVRRVAEEGSDEAIAALISERLRAGQLTRSQVQDVADLDYVPALMVMGKKRRGALKDRWWNARGNRFAVTVLTPMLEVVTHWTWSNLTLRPNLARGLSDRWWQAIANEAATYELLTHTFHPMFIVWRAQQWLDSGSPVLRLLGGQQAARDMSRAADVAGAAGMEIEESGVYHGDEGITEVRHAEALRSVAEAADSLALCMTDAGHMGTQARQAWNVILEANMYYVIGEQVGSERTFPSLNEVMFNYAIPRLLA